MENLGPWKPELNLYGEQGLAETLPQELIERGRLYAFVRGEAIYKSGEPVSYLWIFLKGQGKVYMVQENGQVLLLEFYRPYMVLGDLEFLSSELSTAEVECTVPCVLLRFPMRDVRHYGWDHAPTLRLMMGELARKLYSASVNRRDNQLLPLKERVMGFIEHHGEGGIFRWPAKQQEMAEYFGVSVRHLRRVLSELELEGRIVRRGKELEIVDG